MRGGGGVRLCHPEMGEVMADGAMADGVATGYRLASPPPHHHRAMARMVFGAAGNVVRTYRHPRMDINHFFFASYSL